MEITRQSAVASYVVIPLIDAASRPSYKASPTLAAGDVKIIRHTGGAWDYSNATNLPAIIGGSATKQVLITLTATELTSDNLDYPIIVQFVDQTATKEWDDQEIIIWTKAQTVNLIQILGTAVSTPATAGILDVNIKNIANAVVSTSSAQIGVNTVNAGGTAWNSGAITANSFASDAITAAKIAADVGTELATAIWNALTSGMTTVGSIGKKLADWVVGTITAGQAVNVTQIDGQATNGNNAVLKLKRLDIANDTSDAALQITNSVGDAIDAISTLANGAMIYGGVDGLRLEGTSGVDLKLNTDSSNIGTPIDVTLSASHGSGAWDATATGTDMVSIAGSVDAAEKLRDSVVGTTTGEIDDTAFAPTLTEFDTDIVVATTDQFKDRWIQFTSGANEGAAKPIVAYYLSGGRGHFVTYAFPSAPSNGDTLTIV